MLVLHGRRHSGGSQLRRPARRPGGLLRHSDRRCAGSDLSHQGNQHRHVHHTSRLRRGDGRPQPGSPLDRRENRGSEAMNAVAKSILVMSTLTRRRAINRTLRALYVTILSALALSVILAVVRFWPRQPLAARIPSSTAVLAADGRLLRLTMARDQQYRLWTPLDKVSPEFVEALLLHEDQHFYDHAGVNPVSLVRAASATYSGGVRQGGSTITMQLARLLYGLNTRTVSGKLEQIALAVGLELRYSKHDLLEAHINLLPYGGDVQGIGAASQIYFEKNPSQLALNEALTLVLIPQAPSTRSPLAATEPASLTAARRRLFAQWQASHPQASDQSGPIAPPLPYNSSRELPFEAPHFTGLLLG